MQNNFYIPRKPLYVVDKGFAADGEYYVRGITLNEMNQKSEVVVARIKNEQEQIDFAKGMYYQPNDPNSELKALAKAQQEQIALSGKGRQNKNGLEDVISKTLANGQEANEFVTSSVTNDLTGNQVSMVLYMDNFEKTHASPNNDFFVGNMTRVQSGAATSNNKPVIYKKGMVTFVNTAGEGELPKHDIKVNEQAMMINASEFTNPKKSGVFRKLLQDSLTSDYSKDGMPNITRHGELNLYFTIKGMRFDQLAPELESKIAHTVRSRATKDLDDPLNLGDTKLKGYQIALNEIMLSKYLTEGEFDPNIHDGSTPQGKQLKDNILKMVLDYSENGGNMKPLPANALPMLKNLQHTLIHNPQNIAINANLATIVKPHATLSSSLDPSKVTEMRKAQEKYYEKTNTPLEERKYGEISDPLGGKNIVSLKTYFKNNDNEFAQVVIPANLVMMPFFQTDKDGNETGFFMAIHASGNTAIPPYIGKTVDEKQDLTLNPNGNSYYEHYKFHPSEIVNVTNRNFIVNQENVSKLLNEHAEQLQASRSAIPLAPTIEKAKELPMASLPVISNNNVQAERIPDSVLDGKITPDQVQRLANILGNVAMKERTLSKINPKYPDTPITQVTAEEMSKLPNKDRVTLDNWLVAYQMIEDPDRKMAYKDLEATLIRAYPNTFSPDRSAPERGLRTNLVAELNAEIGYGNRQPRMNILQDQKELVDFILDPKKRELDNEVNLEATVTATKKTEVDKIFQANHAKVAEEEVTNSIDKLAKMSIKKP